MVTWGEKLRGARGLLSDAGLPSPDVDARLLAEWCAGYVPLASEHVTVELERKFDEAVSRRAHHEPIQHIMGVMWFRYLELISTPGAFIVRPETEMVAQAGIDALTRMSTSNPVVVDLCTGSGAIALAIATEVPTSQVWGVERDEKAFEIACENNKKYGSPVTFIFDDARGALPELAGKVDLVITNPPYVPQSQNVPQDVSCDPSMALYGGGEDGLDLPRELVRRAVTLLKAGGVLIMEHGDDQGVALVQEAHSCGLVNVATGVDLTGRDRWLYAERGE
ncbi:peptide chain release factor N(5)-glutamine methyltransferase [Arcanobacterium phocae]|uniref:peptide chain release factor N(5)-glutamine methyltransferase n=1 Tax=Arcanobacterium phocae TaxID=131112 RepID=A0A1H2LAH0_9ACTO|nr:peptide chain release factor N(5)-glutamine methyltransferase [Arcanobacterium phocae]SDU77608.1 release factor glutamine methyltransferase [Arcanobacterium phocae]